MARSLPATGYDALVNVSDYESFSLLGKEMLLGNWFAFFQPAWLAKSRRDKVLALIESSQKPLVPKPLILFRGREIALPGVTIEAKKLPSVKLLSVTSDKALYRAQSDTVRLLLAAPLLAGEKLTLHLKLNGSSYADYTVLLDEYGMALWSMQGLPEGAYEAQLDESDLCRFEVAEYRLALLNAELVEQRLVDNVLHYALTITAVGQPYTGLVELELQDRGTRIGPRVKKQCDGRGQCQGVFKLTGEGPYTLNVFAGERTATVALKGAEQERRETLNISDLGEMYEISLLPLPDSEECRGMHIAREGHNNEPFLVRTVRGREVEIISRTDVELLRVVTINPVQSEKNFAEHVYEQLPAEKSLSFPIPSPYGLVLLGALIDGKAWEGWCAILHPSDLQLDCSAPAEARPGKTITIQLKTNTAGRTVPVQLIVKDQRLIAASDPQVELAACIKKNLTAWSEEACTGEITRKLADAGGSIRLLSAAMPFNMPFPNPTAAPRMMPAGGARIRGIAMPLAALAASTGKVYGRSEVSEPVETAQLTKIRMQFPEVVYNNLLYVDGEISVEVKLGDSMTRYTIEAFALDPETLDWRRAETSVESVQPVYGELTVSPFVFPGDPVMGCLDIGAASGFALVEVQHDGEALPLFLEHGPEVIPGQSVPSGSVLRFPVKPGVITAIVRDASSGEADVSERFIQAPGKVRHITRRLRLLTPGEEIDLARPGTVEIKPMPGLERPFQFFVQSAAAYPFGCVEQTSCKLLAMYAGYVTNLDQPDSAREYEAVLPVWYKRLKSMYLPQSGFCMYPPEEGGKRSPDTHYAPKAVTHLLKLPDAQNAGATSPAIREMLDDIAAMTRDAAAYYKIDVVPRQVTKSEEAYQVLRYSNSSAAQSEALAFVRAHLLTKDGHTLLKSVMHTEGEQLWGASVREREETAYGAAALLLGRDSADLAQALAATNYLADQLNEEGRLYSTIDTEACLALLLALREANIVTTPASGRVAFNGREMSLADALECQEKLTSLRALEGVIAVQITCEFVEDWASFKSEIPVDVRLERNGRPRSRFSSGEALEMVIRVPRYEPGLIAHVCLPDALARIVGGGQVKRFTLDFSEKNELRIPLAVVSSTSLPGESGTDALWRWLGLSGKKEADRSIQHWAVLVRNMFKEEQTGNPGLLEVRIN